MEVLHDKSFRKQGAVSLVGKIGRNKGRWFRNVGLGIKVGPFGCLGVMFYSVAQLVPYM